MECTLTDVEYKKIVKDTTDNIYFKIKANAICEKERLILEEQIDGYLHQLGRLIDKDETWNILENIVKNCLKKNKTNFDKIIEDHIKNKIDKLLSPESLNEKALIIAREKVKELEKAIYNY